MLLWFLTTPSAPSPTPSTNWETLPSTPSQPPTSGSLIWICGLPVWRAPCESRWSSWSLQHTDPSSSLPPGGWPSCYHRPFLRVPPAQGLSLQHFWRMRRYVCDFVLSPRWTTSISGLLPSTKRDVIKCVKDGSCRRFREESKTHVFVFFSIIIK